MLKLAELLQAAGHKVWIDVNEMRGSTVDAMAEVGGQCVWLVYCMLLFCLCARFYVMVGFMFLNLF